MSSEETHHSQSARGSLALNDLSDDAAYGAPDDTNDGDSDQDPYGHIQNQLGLPTGILNELAGTKRAISKWAFCSS